jgi:anthranilate phosphoribosyltransferase
VSPAGPTRVAELREGEVREYEIFPEELGLERVGLDELAGAEPARNAAIIESVLAGTPGPARSAVVANAAAALVVAGLAHSWEQGARLAEASIDQGKATAALERLRAATRQRGAPSTS